MDKLAMNDMRILRNYIVRTTEHDTFLITGCADEHDAIMLARMQYDQPESIRVTSITLDRNGLPNMAN